MKKYYRKVERVVKARAPKSKQVVKADKGEPLGVVVLTGNRAANADSRIEQNEKIFNHPDFGKKEFTKLPFWEPDGSFLEPLEPHEVVKHLDKKGLSFEDIKREAKSLGYTGQASTVQGIIKGLQAEGADEDKEQGEKKD